LRSHSSAVAHCGNNVSAVALLPCDSKYDLLNYFWSEA
jgi:hypothetical protein